MKNKTNTYGITEKLGLIEKMKNLEAPDKTEYDKLYNNSFLIKEKVFVKLQTLRKALDTELNRTSDNIMHLVPELTKVDFFNALKFKVFHSIKSGVMVMYYYKKLKSDEKWITENFQILPDYQKEDIYIKDWFDYFSDNYFTQISSSFDLLSNLLNNYLKLEIEKPSFESIINCLNKKTVKRNYGTETRSIFLEIQKEIKDQIKDNTAFEEFKVIRNNIVHNISPFFPHQEASLERNDKNKIKQISIKSTYIKSKDRLELMDSLNHLFLKTIDIIIEKTTKA